MAQANDRLAFPSPYAKKPLKSVYSLFALVKSYLTYPFLLVYYLPKSHRPHPSWSVRRAALVRSSYNKYDFLAAIEYKFPRNQDAGVEGERFVVVDPKPYTLKYNGILNTSPDIKPQIICGIWYPTLFRAAAQQTTDKKNVFLHFHASAYVLHDAREATYGAQARLLSKVFDDALVFMPEYRLATWDQGAFPGALQDAVTSYLYLIETLGIPASRILISGDSAGGNLALALLRYISDSQNMSPAQTLPFPLAATLYSPWVDLESNFQSFESRNTGRDFQPPALLQWGVRELTGFGKLISPSHKYLTFRTSPFKVPIPIWTSVGELEIFHEAVLDFVEKMREIGNVAGLHETMAMPHDVFAFSFVLKQADWAEAAMRDSKLFIENNG